MEELGAMEEEREVKKRLMDLPNEMISEIFKKLEIKDKVKFGETCKWLHENYLENMKEEGIKVQFYIEKSWLGGSRETFGHENVRILITGKDGKTMKSYLNEKIEDGFNETWKCKLVYDREIRAHYFRDDYTEFEKRYKCKEKYFRHKRNLYARFEKEF